MLKLLTGFLTSIMLAIGMLVAVPAAPASAADCPYTGCIETRTHIKRPREVKPKTPFKITCRVRVVGTAKPVGRLRLTIRGVERKPRKTYYRSSVSSFDSNGRHTFRIKGIRKPGQYRPTCAFKAEPNSAFNNSSVSKRLLVRYRNRS